MKKQGRAAREAYREYLRERFIEEYHRQELTEQERAARIAKVDLLVDAFLAFANTAEIVPTAEGIIFTEGEGTFIQDDENELDEV